MDQIVIDTGAESFPVGTSATVFGPDGGATPTIQDWARWAGTIPHTIVTGIGPRVTQERRMTRRVVVIGGGENAEHDVSLATAAAVAAALRRRGFDVDELTIDRDGTWRRGADALGSQAISSLAAALRVIERADVVFPAVHGPSGEDGTLAALCALTHTPMVGSGLRAGALGMDKWATKLVAEAVGIRTAPGRLVTAAEIADIEFETDVVVKPASSGSSFGVALARDASQLRDALRGAARFDDRILIEHVVEGREIDVAVLREADGCRWASPPLEIHDRRPVRHPDEVRRVGPVQRARRPRPRRPGRPDRARRCGCSTRSAAPESPASTSSSPTTAPSSTRSTPCRG